MSKRRNITIPAAAMLAFSLFLWVAENKHVSAQKSTDQKPVVIFSVSSTAGNPKETFVEPVLLVEKGAYATPIAGDSGGEAQLEFANKYYKAGQKYQLLFGGAEAGHVTVLESMSGSECFRAGAKIRLSNTPVVKLNRNVLALATNVVSLARPQGLRRSPTASERAEALRLAKQIFVAKGSPTAILPTLEVVNLTATYIDNDDKAELIGTFVLKKTRGGAERHVLFLIMEPDRKGHRTVVTNYGRFTNKDIMSGGDIDSIGADGIYTERLVDHVDLDADGTGEVISITNGFEGVTYRVYKKQTGKWVSVYEFASYRCAF